MGTTGRAVAVRWHRQSSGISQKNSSEGKGVAAGWGCSQPSWPSRIRTELFCSHSERQGRSSVENGQESGDPAQNGASRALHGRKPSLSKNGEIGEPGHHLCWATLAQSKRQHPECPDFGNLLAERPRVRCVGKTTDLLFKIDEILGAFP